jgi:hypothetical protein
MTVEALRNEFIYKQLLGNIDAATQLENEAVAIVELST